jgi:hypothetical protein
VPFGFSGFSGFSGVSGFAGRSSCPGGESGFPGLSGLPGGSSGLLSGLSGLPGSSGFPGGVSGLPGGGVTGEPGSSVVEESPPEPGPRTSSTSTGSGAGSSRWKLIGVTVSMSVSMRAWAPPGSAPAAVAAVRPVNRTTAPVTTRARGLTPASQVRSRCEAGSGASGAGEMPLKSPLASRCASSADGRTGCLAAALSSPTAPASGASPGVTGRPASRASTVSSSSRWSGSISSL